MIVGLFGEFGIANFGNEASLAAALRSLRAQPELVPLVICDSPVRVRAEHHVEAVAVYAAVRRRTGPAGKIVGKLADLRQVVQAVRRVDAVMVPGTGIFESQWVEPGGIPLSLAELALVCRVLRRPLLVVSVGVDVARRRATRALVRFTLSSASYLTVRDEASAAAVATLNVRTLARVRPDIVFGRGVADHERRSRGTTPTAALGVLDYHGMSDDPVAGRVDREGYLDKLVEVARGLVERNYAVRVVVGAEPDHALARELMARVAADRELRASRPGIELVAMTDLGELLGRITDADVLVGSRFHNLVAAFAAGVPVVSIGYGHKQVELMRDFGFPRLNHDITSFTAAAVLAGVDEVRGDRAGHVQRILRRVVELGASLADQDRDVVRQLRGPVREPEVAR